MRVVAGEEEEAIDRKREFDVRRTRLIHIQPISIFVFVVY